MQFTGFKYHLCLCVGLLFTLITFSTMAQDRCGIVEVTENRRAKNVLRERDDQFEEWMQNRRARMGARAQAMETYRIPVVVHIVHKGEAVGTGANLSEAQILSQIAVLNRDFNRLNTDAANTPSEFQAVAANMDIEFILAQQTPDGLSTNGILRSKGSQNQWTINDEEKLKATSYWPSADYLNIWVTDLSSTLLGYAQFPVSDLAGLEDASDNALTDGVVIDYSVFGSRDDGAFSLTANFNKGRTATHEVGHFFGLRHIWGDDNGSCGGNNDYVSDTPDQGNSTSGCPSNPQTSCSVHTMFQNYMDYTNDACMNLFTAEQVGRMVTVVENSPRRTSLLTSHALNALAANDMGIVSVLSPGTSMCSGTVAPAIHLQNYGTNVVSSTTLQFTINGVVYETRDVSFSTPVQMGATADITFSSLPLASGSYELGFRISKTNGTTDGNATNDEDKQTTWVPYSTTLPFTEIFDVLPSKWNIDNSDNGITWASKTAPSVLSSNGAAFLDFYNYADADAESDKITTSQFDLTSAKSPYLILDVAYAQRSSLADGLKIYVLTGCESSVASGTLVYNKAGSTLSTASARSAAFTPSGASEWRTEIVDLAAFKGQSQVQIAFVGINNHGNNLYIDNISVVEQVFENVAIKKVISPSPVMCDTDAIPVLAVTNVGTVPVTSLAINYRANNNAVQTFKTSAGFQLMPGADSIITLPSITFADDSNTLSFEVIQPNGFNDIDPSDNSIVYAMKVNTVSDRIPLRQNFDDDTYEEKWTVINPLGGAVWSGVNSNYDQSLYFDASGDSASNDEAWLVTPSLDFTASATASVFFDIAYAVQSSGNREAVMGGFRVLASTDCGNTYDVVLFDGTSHAMAAARADAAPTSDTEWEKIYLNLNELTGKGQVRLAFVAVNGTGSKVYLDNVEFFISDNPSPLLATKPFVVYGTDPGTPQDFYVTFNLEQRQDVVYNLVDMAGRTIAEQQLPDVLNQTYQVEANTVSTGIYILRLQIGGEYYAEKIYIGQ